MYCKYCGKYVLGNRDVCDDCIAKQNTTSQCSQPQYAQNTPNKMPSTTKEGFGKGLASTILSESSIVTLYLSIILIAMAMTLLTPPTGGTQPVDQTTGTVFFIFGVLITLITIAANVISIIFGVQAIKNFSYARKYGLPKPVLAFVFGLIGLIGACFILTYTSLFNGIIILGFLTNL